MLSLTNQIILEGGPLSISDKWRLKMKLSMSMIQWYMRDHKQIAHIQNDTLSIRGLRFLSGNMSEILPEFMYLGEASSYISDKRYEQAYIVVHQKNHILFFQGEFEDLLNGLLAAFDFFGAWERKMVYASDSGSSIQKIIDLSCEILCNPVTVMDLEGNTVALNSFDVPEEDLYWKYKQEEGQEHPSILSEQWFSPDGVPIHELSHTPQLVQNVQQGQAPLVMMYLFQDEEPVAVFYILIVNRELITMNMQIADEISKYLTFSEEFFKRNIQLRSMEKLMQDFLESQLGNDAEGETAAEKLRRSVGDGKWRLALLRHAFRKDRVYIKSMLRILKNAVKVPCIFYHDDILFLVSEIRQAEILDFLCRQMPSGSLFLALSMPTIDFFSLPLRYGQALFTVGQASEGSGVYKCEAFAFPYIKAQVAQLLSSMELQHPALTILEEYDRLNHTSLRESLSVFLQKQCSILETAKAMHVHRNTIKYRIARIQEVTGITFEDDQEIQYLCLSDWLL